MYVLSEYLIIGDLSVFFFGFCFEKIIHRPCVTYGKSENHMHQIITIPRAYGFQNFDTTFPSNVVFFQRYCTIISKLGRNRTNEGKIYKFQFFPSLFGISYDFLGIPDFFLHFFWNLIQIFLEFQFFRNFICLEQTGLLISSVYYR